jgi:hypothetical protein
MTNRDDLNSLICGACQRLANIPAGERLCHPCVEQHIMEAEVGATGPNTVLGRLEYNDAMAEAPELPELDDETLDAMAQELDR